MKKYVDTTKLNLPKTIEHEFKEFCRALQDIYEDEITSIIVYGSVARREYFAERSDINVLIVIEHADLDTLRKAVDAIHKARETCKVTPFFLTPEDMDTSRDVFPIKFYDMLDAYEVVYGRDLLAGMEIDDGNLRLELEQEMKILMLELRQFYMQRAKKGGPGGAEHLLAYFNSFLYLMKRLLKMQGHQVPMQNDELIKTIASTYDMDGEMMRRFLDYKRGKPLKSAPDEAIPFYKEVYKGAMLIDKLEVPHP
ncbi:MAG TPA: nucleotidyltransferase domain-containing protein [Planctomycetota bacterium]|nr:nucleotidyltransferase domain-containing protein [Planctomycetota bacterium]